MNKQRFILENVLLEDGFNFDKNIVVSTKVKSKDILISNGKIEGIYEMNSFNDNIERINMKGMLAIPSFKQPEVLIAGGLDRGFTFDDLVPLFKKHVKSIVLYGETRYLLADAARKAGIKDIVIVNTLQEAVPRAWELVEPGDVLLFSPACASWDQFRTFEERGDYFVRFVEELKTK